jgi:hypothetical protein
MWKYLEMIDLNCRVKGTTSNSSYIILKYLFTMSKQQTGGFLQFLEVMIESEL